MRENIGEKLNAKKRNDETRIFRHSIAEYKLDEGIVQSENPERPPKANDQQFDSDLTPEGKEFARKKAEEFFDAKNPETGELLMNPEADALYFVSSDLVRAAETAKIFLDIARERGFEIIPSREKYRFSPRNKAEEIGEGYIRKINCLTLNHLGNMLREKIFMPNDYLAEVVKDQQIVSEETRAKWKEARAIIESDNKDTWGKNYHAHSEKIAKIFPNVKSAEEVYKSKFFKIINLIKFAQNKIKEKNPEKNIKILGFSHENSFIHFLNENFGESMENCENIGFKVADGENEVPKILITAKGKTIEFKE